MQLTRSNIAYNLSISPHRLNVTYGEDSLTFVFSSDLYKKKFTEKQDENRESISNSLSKRFGIKVEYPILADIKLYTTIEKRGFLLLRNEVEVECLTRIILDGERVTLKNSED